MRPSRFSAALLALVACARPSPAPAPVIVERANGSDVALVSSFDLPRDDVRSRELSGIAWDDRARVLVAVPDSSPVIITLRPDAEYRTWAFGDSTPLTVQDAWDGEGVALLEDGYLVANERGPHIYAFDRRGNIEQELQLPSCYARCAENRSLESLSLTADKRFLFTANESTSLEDGPAPTTTTGALVRVLRRDRVTGKDVVHAYRTDPIFAAGPHGEIGVSDVLALSATTVLVMERAYVPNVGNSVRIYRAEFEGPDLIDAEPLAPNARVMEKKLFVDLGRLPGAEIQGRGAHHLPNYEGLALGPKTADGRRLLFAISDDNASASLVARVLVLAARGPGLSE